MDNYQPQVDEFGLYISPHPPYPSPLDYEDEDFPITGAVTKPRKDCGNCAGLGCAQCHGSGVEGFGRV